MTKRPITPEGYQRLRKEMDVLWSIERPRVVQEVSDAAAQGDRSENAEYIYGKKRLREIDKRSNQIRSILDKVLVIEETPKDQDKIYFGARVKLRDQSDEIHEYRIVGSDEFEMDKNMLSLQSPIAKGLMRKKVGDSVKVQLPKGEMMFTVEDIKYK